MSVHVTIDTRDESPWSYIKNYLGHVVVPHRLYLLHSPHRSTILMSAYETHFPRGASSANALLSSSLSVRKDPYLQIAKAMSAPKKSGHCTRQHPIGVAYLDPCPNRILKHGALTPRPLATKTLTWVNNGAKLKQLYQGASPPCSLDLQRSDLRKPRQQHGREVAG
jgi:hypothetical protein